MRKPSSFTYESLRICQNCLDRGLHIFTQVTSQENLSRESNAESLQSSINEIDENKERNTNGIVLCKFKSKLE